MKKFIYFFLFVNLVIQAFTTSNSEIDYQFHKFTHTHGKQYSSIEEFEKRFQVSFKNVYGKVIDPLLNEGLITFNQNQMALSRKGLFIADSVILKFLA